MIFYIIIPVHNEEKSIGKTLESLVSQTLLPNRLVVVNDNSTDNTQSIINRFTQKYDWMSSVSISTEDLHVPGGKIIHAFNMGLKTLDANYDVICKFDGDLVFPENYLEQLKEIFISNKRLGMAAGLCTILKNDSWIIEGVTGRNHIRGALKAYRKPCFEAIGGLRPSLGWDTVDELLAEYHGWSFEINPALLVRHLVPTGSRYSERSGLLQGRSLYVMRFGLGLSIIRAFIQAIRRGRIQYLSDIIKGYVKAKRNEEPFIVSEAEGNFIKKKQIANMRKKLIRF